MTELKALALTIMCARCEARPGDPCTTITGGRATQLHSARTYPVDQAYGIGYVEADDWWTNYTKTGDA